MFCNTCPEQLHKNKPIYVRQHDAWLDQMNSLFTSDEAQFVLVLAWLRLSRLGMALFGLASTGWILMT